MDETSHSRSCNEYHSKEQETASQENSRKKLVFLLPQAITQDAEKPQESNSCKWNEVQGKRHSSEPVFSHEPVSCGLTGTDCQNSQRLQVSRREKRIPAMAAARGVFTPG